jgi:uncharacterized DUF497 family protein
MVDAAVSPVFDWDDGNRAHCCKHGVSIAEIKALLRGTPRVAPDLKHAHLEDRLIAVGRTAGDTRSLSPSRSGRSSDRGTSAR